MFISEMCIASMYSFLEDDFDGCIFYEYFFIDAIFFLEETCVIVGLSDLFFLWGEKG